MVLFMLSKKTRGYSLLETIIGITILSVGILSVLSIVVKMISAQDYIKHREQATLFAEETLEVFKIKLEDNFLKCRGSDQAYLDKSWNCWGKILFEGDNCYCGGEPDIFSMDKSYTFIFSHDNWTINSALFNSWNKIYYNCLEPKLCYYSHDKENSNSIETIYEKRVIITDTYDYNGDYYDDVIKVDSTVRWKERGTYKQVTIISDLYNWR